LTPAQRADKLRRRMFIHFDQVRPSDSPFIERVWSCHSDSAGTFLSVSACNLEIVVSRVEGQAMLTIRGPETRPSELACPADGEWFAIRFKTGTFMPQFPTSRLLNNVGVTLPQPSRRQFILDGRKWEMPTFENAEEFVKRLVSKDLLKRDAEIAAALQDEPRAFSTRTAQRRFLRVVGMPFNVMRQIERARFAVNLLREGVSIADAVWQCGYYDHAHLTRSLQRWIGIPPSKVTDSNIQLSFLYKTEGFTLP
jgi:AraC-like DNA-binding protein